MSADDTARTARAALRVEETCASACLRALRCLFDQQWLAWEPETLWIELNHQGVNVPVGNRNQIMAGRSLITTGRFWYDATAFEAACIAFSNDLPTYFGVEDAPVAFLNWGVYEATLIHKDFEDEVLEFDREPISYCAVQLFEQGFIIAPEHLAMAQPELNKALPNDIKALQKEVREGWAAAPHGKALLDAAYPETAAGVQLARLASVQLHFDTRLATLEQQIRPFKDC